MSNTANMASLGDADFTNFLVDLDLNFSDNLSVDQSASIRHASSAQQHELNLNPHLMSNNDVLGQNAAMFDFSMSLDMQFPITRDSSLHHPAHSQGLMPPTPNSVEMHQNAARYLQQYEANRLMMEQYQLKSHDAASFTPLVSPIVPTHDSSQYEMPCYTVPGAYFSPLTSPALEGQQQALRTAGSSSSITVSSPINLDIDMPDAQSKAPPASRARKRPTAPRSAAMIKSRTSPHVKAQSRRKDRSNLSISETSLSMPLDQVATNGWAQSPNMAHASCESVSPEPLSESMGPPQKPASATVSPAILAKIRARSSDGMPATPASYLKIQQSQQSSPRSRPHGLQRTGSSDVQHPLLTPLALPEAASTPLVLDESSPVLSPRKTPKFGLLSTPSGSATPADSFMTTHSATVNSPMSSTFASTTKKIDRSRSSKKRGSITSSVLISPALRPKIAISPNIKPLLPDGGADNDADAHTMFLASRSNYQNLLEGTHVPGVSYPQELSNNLTSKRTSHKIAEQGRRNRINLALQEMLHLLPKNRLHEEIFPKDDDSSPGDNNKKDSIGGKANGNSKAATVESAIDYIKTLQKEHEDMKIAKERRDLEIDILRKRLDDMAKLIGEQGTTMPNEEKKKSSSKT